MVRLFTWYSFHEFIINFNKNITPILIPMQKNSQSRNVMTKLHSKVIWSGKAFCNVLTKRTKKIRENTNLNVVNTSLLCMRWRSLELKSENRIDKCTDGINKESITVLTDFQEINIKITCYENILLFSWLTTTSI